MKAKSILIADIDNPSSPKVIKNSEFFLKFHKKNDKVTFYCGEIKIKNLHFSSVTNDDGHISLFKEYDFNSNENFLVRIDL